MQLEARAKINWTLDITGETANGYHLMDMLMQPVTLCDDVTLERAPELSLTCGGTPYLPPDERHLALRAARALKGASGYASGAAIHVEKHIPVGAGMGGGSADAAAVLLGLNRLWGLNWPQEKLEALGLTLGADVPFCLRGGLARVQGIGEKMQPVYCKKTWALCVVQPCEGLSTGEVFRAYHTEKVAARPDNDAAARALSEGNLSLLAASMGNALQSVSERMRPEIAGAIAQLKAMGATAALMTGSGSAVFGVFEDDERAENTAAKLRVQYPRCWACRTALESVAER